MKYIKAVIGLIFLAILSIFLHSFIDYFVDPTTGIMVTTYADWCSDSLVAIVGALPWIMPLIGIVVTIIYLAKPEKPKGIKY